MSDCIAGGCLCGAVRYEVDSIQGEACHCHCGNCQKSTGSGVVTWISVESDAFRITKGTPNSYTSSEDGVRQFCSDCGSPLTFVHNSYVNMLDVTLNTLDNPDTLPPGRHYWASRKLPWIKIDGHLPQILEE